jgi:hypothetical protein
MDATSLANLLAQLIPVGIEVYNQIQQANQSTVPPLATVLAKADADWDAVAKLAQSQLTPPASSAAE